MNLSKSARSIRKRLPILQARNSFDQMACRIAQTAQEQYAAACLIVTNRGVIGVWIEVCNGFVGDAIDALRGMKTSGAIMGGRPLRESSVSPSDVD
jgi:hypothetical protein